MDAHKRLVMIQIMTEELMPVQDLFDFAVYHSSLRGTAIIHSIKPRQAKTQRSGVIFQARTTNHIKT